MKKSLLTLVAVAGFAAATAFAVPAAIAPCPSPTDINSTATTSFWLGRKGQDLTCLVFMGNINVGVNTWTPIVSGVVASSGADAENQVNTQRSIDSSENVNGKLVTKGGQNYTLCIFQTGVVNGNKVMISTFNPPITPTAFPPMR